MKTTDHDTGKLTIALSASTSFSIYDLLFSIREIIVRDLITKISAVLLNKK
jgi:hypothetical protein